MLHVSQVCNVVKRNHVRDPNPRGFKLCTLTYRHMYAKCSLRIQSATREAVLHDSVHSVFKGKSILPAHAWIG